MKRYTFVITIILISIFATSYCQENIEIPLNSETEWSPFYEDENIILSSKKMICIDPAGGPTIKRLLLKIQNKTGKSILVNWHYDIYNTNGCITCDDTIDENLFRLILSPNQTISPDCGTYKLIDKESGTQETLGVYLKYSERIDVSDTQKIILSDFSIYKLN